MKDVKWVQKECLNNDWKPGKDFEDCIKEEVQAFPSIKFESKDGSVKVYEGQRTVNAMHKFAEERH